MTFPYTKAQQTKKNKAKNPKKLTGKDKINYIDFLRERSDEKCQMPDCNNDAQDWEHPDRGIHRDDRYTIMICRKCHMIADGHTLADVKERIALKEHGKRIGRENWKAYREHDDSTNLLL
jgi:hypothetical protein